PDVHDEANVLRELGDRMIDAESRAELYAEAAAVFADPNSCIFGRAETQEAASRLAAHAGELENAIALATEARDLFRRGAIEHGDHSHSELSDDRHGRVERWLASLELRRGRFPAASEHLEAALKAFRATHNVVAEAATHRELAEAVAEWQGV